MECYTCGKELDILYKCEQCKETAGYCSEHRYEHDHVKADKNTEKIKEVDPLNQDYTGIPQGKTITNENLWRLVDGAWTAGSEKIDLIIASLLLTFIFWMNYAFDFPDFDPPTGYQLKFIFVIGILVSITFVVHELSHKYTAIYYGHDARFILNIIFIGVSLVLILLDWSFIWIGAAYVLPKHGMGEEGGIIAGVGPFSNLIMGTLGIVSYYVLGTAGMLFFLVWDIPLVLWIQFFIYLNGFIGLFNMLPFSIFDGAKIWAWNKNAWISLTLGLLIMWMMGQTLTPFTVA